MRWNPCLIEPKRIQGAMLWGFKRNLDETTVCFLMGGKKFLLIPRAWKISMSWNMWHFFICFRQNWGIKKNVRFTNIIENTKEDLINFGLIERSADKLMPTINLFSLGLGRCQSPSHNVRLLDVFLLQNPALVEGHLYMPMGHLPVAVDSQIGWSWVAA